MAGHPQGSNSDDSTMKAIRRWQLCADVSDLILLLAGLTDYASIGPHWTLDSLQFIALIRMVYGGWQPDKDLQMHTHTDSHSRALGNRVKTKRTVLVCVCVGLTNHVTVGVLTAMRRAGSPSVTLWRRWAHTMTFPGRSQASQHS